MDKFVIGFGVLYFVAIFYFAWLADIKNARTSDELESIKADWKSEFRYEWRND